MKGLMNKVECSMDASKPGVLILVCKMPAAYDGLRDPEREVILQGILNERVRKEVTYELVLDEAGEKYSKISHSKVPNMEIETDDSFDEEEF